MRIGDYHPDYYIAIDCLNLGCGQHASMSRDEAVEAFGFNITIGEIRARAVCSACRAAGRRPGPIAVVIIFKGKPAKV